MSERATPLCTDKCLATCPVLTEQLPDGTRRLRAGLQPWQAELLLDVARRAIHLDGTSCEGKPAEMRKRPGDMYCGEHPEVVGVAKGLVLAAKENLMSVTPVIPAGQPEV